MLIIFIEKNFFIKFHLPKFDLISQERLIFLVLGFAKYLQVSFLRLVTTVFVFFSLAVIFELVLNLFQQHVHQLSDPLFQRLFLWLFQQFFFGNILYIVFEYFTNCHEGVTNHTRPFVFISITPGFFIKVSCPLAWMIHDCILYRPKNFNLFQSLSLMQCLSR